MNWVKFLLIAVCITVVCLGGLGGWLLPELGVRPDTARGMAAALAGGLIAVLYFWMRRRAAGS